MLSQLKANIETLISLYEKQKSRADALEARLGEAELAAKSYREQITELTGQIENLKLASAFSATGDSTLAKESIDKLIREIDKCIKLLEKEN